MRRCSAGSWVVLPALLVAGCGGPTGLPDLRLGEGLTELYQAGSSGLRQPTQAIASTEAEWQVLWSAIRVSAEPVPRVDFEHALVIAAGYGERPTGGYVIHIDSVTPSAVGQAVHVTKYRPGRGCIVTLVVTEPVHVVAAPRGTGVLGFVEREREYACE